MSTGSEEKVNSLHSLTPQGELITPPTLSELIELYTAKLKEFKKLLDDSSNKQFIEHITYELLTTRDSIEQKMINPRDMNGSDFICLYKGDEEFFDILKNVYARRRELGFCVDRWRYVHLQTNRQYWWWFAPSSVQRSGDYFVSRQYSRWRILATVIFIMAAVALVISLVGFIVNEQVLSATINVVVQLVMGGLVFSPYTSGFVQFIGRTFSNVLVSLSSKMIT